MNQVTALLRNAASSIVDFFVYSADSRGRMLAINERYHGYWYNETVEIIAGPYKGHAGIVGLVPDDKDEFPAGEDYVMVHVHPHGQTKGGAYWLPVAHLAKWPESVHSSSLAKCG